MSKSQKLRKELMRSLQEMLITKIKKMSYVLVHRGSTLAGTPILTDRIRPQSRAIIIL